MRNVTTVRWRATTVSGFLGALGRLVQRSPGVALSTLIAVSAFVLVAAGQPVSTTSGAGPSQETTTTVAPEGQPPEQDAEQLALGASIFSRTCTSCHQAGGVGIVGQFPPLKDNPNVTDPAYVQQVVTEGRQGTIEVKGQTYNGVMPAVGAGLSDEEVAAVSAYVAGNLTLPEGVEAAPIEEPTMPSPPDYAMALFAVGFGLTGVVAALVLAPLALARTDRVHLSWMEATLKALVIVAYFVVAVVLLPARVMENDRVADLSPDAQYLVGSAVWGGGLLVGLVALWWARRKGVV